MANYFIVEITDSNLSTLSCFNCYEQRKYDYDELEKKLLGLDEEKEREEDKENNMEEAV
ncbi:hypothetical protein [Clostridium ganghwense]|uniref:Uncharacterized protein n=1 Tax=Clostridium ganghwense TaxID=312089 RepID=A0ABT4CRU6_9CLOT|nr:hypothetical protein [Clostridium ganghwense]MCY6371767.1 hypothetical protein [Clostridium ganghwense]